jgi:hypothetical protein
VNVKHPIPALTGVATAVCLVLSSAAGAWAAGPSRPSLSLRATPAFAVALAPITSQLDIDGDGNDDAVVGDPYATVTGHREAGVVVVLWGGYTGTIGKGPRRTVLTQASFPGSKVETGDHFGWAVAMGDGTQDGRADILVGSPGEDWSGHPDAGITHLISAALENPDSYGELSAILTDQGDVGGTVETGDRFGSAVALWNTAGGHQLTGAIGAPGEDLRGQADAGVVNSFSRLGPGSRGQQVEQGGLAGLPGTSEAGDRFGAAVLVAPMQTVFGDDAGLAPTIVVGAPGDRVQPSGSPVRVRGGSVTSWDTSVGSSQRVTQDSPGVPGIAEEGDLFGSSLAFSKATSSPGADGDLVIGAPGEDLGSRRDAGAVSVFADELENRLQGRWTFTQDSEGFAGAAEAGDRFGQSVAMLPGPAAENLLVVGTPDEDVGSVADAGMAQTVAINSGSVSFHHVLSYTENAAGTPGRVRSGSHFGLVVSAMEGADESAFTVSSPYQGSGSVFVVSSTGQTRSWVPGADGIPVLSSGRFGWSVSGTGHQR